MTLETPGLLKPGQTDQVSWVCWGVIMGFWWWVSPGFLIPTLGNLLITDCWGIDLKFQPLEELSHPLDSWPGGGRSKRRRRVLFNLSAHTLILKIRKSMRQQIHFHQSRQLGCISEVWPEQNMFLSRRLKGNLCFFWWRSTLGDSGRSCFSSVFPTRVITRLLVCPGPHIVVSHQ